MGVQNGCPKMGVQKWVSKNGCPKLGVQKWVSKNGCPKWVSKMGVPKVRKKVQKFKSSKFQCLRPSTSLMAAGKNNLNFDFYARHK
jgi:hypothetical protein